MLRDMLNESGVQNIRELAKTYKEAEIYYHMDLDGVIKIYRRTE